MTGTSPESSKFHQPQLWTTFSLAVLAGSAFILVLVIKGSCRADILVQARQHYLRCEEALSDVWDAGLHRPTSRFPDIEQDKNAVILTTSITVLIVAILDCIVSNRLDCHG